MISRDGNFNNLNAKSINSSSLTTNNLIVNNSYSLIKSPSFMSYIPGPILNVTGSGTAYQLGSNGTYVNLYNRGMQINSSGLFTCLYDGIYNFVTNIFTIGYTVSGSILMKLNVYNENVLEKVYISRTEKNPSFISSSSMLNVQISLTKGQTVSVSIIVESEPTNNIDIHGLDTDIIGNYFYGNFL